MTPAGDVTSSAFMDFLRTYTPQAVGKPAKYNPLAFALAGGDDTLLSWAPPGEQVAGKAASAASSNDKTALGLFVVAAAALWWWWR